MSTLRAVPSLQTGPYIARTRIKSAIVLYSRLHEIKRQFYSVTRNRTRCFNSMSDQNMIRDTILAFIDRWKAHNM